MELAALKKRDRDESKKGAKESSSSGDIEEYKLRAQTASTLYNLGKKLAKLPQLKQAVTSIR